MKQEGPPENFICPLTLDVMQDPVQHKTTGHTFERHAIMDWIKLSSTCPLTRQPLKPSDLVPHDTLRDEIAIWHQLAAVERILSSTSSSSSKKAASFSCHEEDSGQSRSARKGYICSMESNHCVEEQFSFLYSAPNESFRRILTRAPTGRF